MSEWAGSLRQLAGQTNGGCMRFAYISQHGYLDIFFMGLT
jgi:hypothetical protein